MMILKEFEMSHVAKRQTSTITNFLQESCVNYLRSHIAIFLAKETYFKYGSLLVQNASGQNEGGGIEAKQI